MEIADKGYYEYANFRQEILGSLSGWELKAMAAAGELSHSGSFVREAGQAEWELAGKWKRLFGGPPVPPPPSAWASAVDLPLRSLHVLLGCLRQRRASFLLYCILSFSALGFSVFALSVINYTLNAGRSYSLEWGEILLASSMAAGLASYAAALLILSKGWRLVQGQPGVTTSPGKAIGLFFVPVFNFMWAFVAWPGWIKHYQNRIHEMGRHDAPTLRPWPFYIALPLTLLSVVFRFLYELYVVGGDRAGASAATLGILATEVSAAVFWWIGILGFCKGSNYLINSENTRCLEEHLAFVRNQGALRR